MSTDENTAGAAQPRLCKGDLVRLTCQHGHAVDAEVLLASPNGRSLALTFDQIVRPTDDSGGYVGMMPVLLDEAGDYRELVCGTIVKVELVRRPGGDR